MPGLEPSQAVKSIVDRFLRDEIDVEGAARELRALRRDMNEQQYLAFPASQWSDPAVRAKLAALNAAMEGTGEVRFARFPFRRADFLVRAETERRQAARGGLIWLGPLIVILLIGTFVLLPAFPRIPRVPFYTLFLIVFITTALVLGLRGQRSTRRHGLNCPYCGVDLTGTDRYGGAAYLAVLATGQCPQCDRQLIDPSELGAGTA
jgi:hypothetical protein